MCVHNGFLNARSCLDILRWVHLVGNALVRALGYQILATLRLYQPTFVQFYISTNLRVENSTFVRLYVCALVQIRGSFSQCSSSIFRTYTVSVVITTVADCRMC